MKYWWVSQGQTYKQEVYEGFMWSPKYSKNGRHNQFFDNMTKVEPGDVIFSYFNQAINAIGIAQSRAKSEPKPQFGKVGANWSNEGWLVDVEFSLVDAPLSLSKHMDTLASTLPSKYSPIKVNGDGNQVYLCSLPVPMANELKRLLNGQVEGVLAKHDAIDTVDQNVNLDDEEEKLLASRTDIGERFKLQLIKARRGQGLFRKNLSDVESVCRVSGVTVATHLIASHIKPWRDSTDEEKIDGNNGLLLSPHVDHLFDRGYITFSDNGKMIVSSELSDGLLKHWAIEPTKHCGEFNDFQKEYMRYHRDNMFKK
ncbi:HNH endonuclease [Methylophilus flavus]|uniref:HNH endonuclease n=1 Tax=Methylophilus flavus TaxID=640084 RepID=A0ABW3PAW9_9PROT